MGRDPGVTPGTPAIAGKIGPTLPAPCPDAIDAEQVAECYGVGTGDGGGAIATAGAKDENLKDGSGGRGALSKHVADTDVAHSGGHGHIEKPCQSRRSRGTQGSPRAAIHAGIVAGRDDTRAGGCVAHTEASDGGGRSKIDNSILGARIGAHSEFKQAEGSGGVDQHSNKDFRPSIVEVDQRP